MEAVDWILSLEVMMMMQWVLLSRLTGDDNEGGCYYFIDGY